MKKINMVLISAVILFFIYLFIKDRIVKPEELRRKGIIVSAWTLEWVIGSKGSFDLKYEFFYNESRIVGYAPFSKFRGDMNFVHKYFPVIYEPMSGDKELLIEPRRFNEYNIPFPDSLKWVLPHVRD